MEITFKFVRQNGEIQTEKFTVESVPSNGEMINYEAKKLEYAEPIERNVTVDDPEWRGVYAVTQIERVLPGDRIFVWAFYRRALADIT